MLRAIEYDFSQTSGATGIARPSDAVLDAMRAVPRHRFVPPEFDDDAYDNRPLPIGHGQTISQPFIVALMTELAALGPNERRARGRPRLRLPDRVSGGWRARVHSVEIVEAAVGSRGRAAGVARGKTT